MPPNDIWWAWTSRHWFASYTWRDNAYCFGVGLSLGYTDNGARGIKLEAHLGKNKLFIEFGLRNKRRAL